MRLAILFILSMAACCAPAQAEGLRHNWRQGDAEGAVQFVSNYPAPEPYSATGEPEATLTMEASKVPAGMTLEDILKNELADIGDGSLVIADYVEKDGHKPDHNVVSYIEKIDGEKVAFIKYRVAGNTNGMLPEPRGVMHAILLKGGKVYFFHLIVVYPAHLDEVRADQLTMVRSMIRR